MEVKALEKTKKKRSSMARLLLLSGLILVLFFIIFLIFAFFMGKTVINADSMAATLSNTLFYVICAALLLGLIIFLLSTYRLAEKKGVLEENELDDSHFMTDRELSKSSDFVRTDLSKLGEFSDGIPLRLIVDGKKAETVFIKKPIHVNVIGSTGTGKTTSFIDPVLQAFPRFKTQPCMIITDPKGELYRKHADFLKESGYLVLAADYRKPYQSAKVNPFQPVIDRIHEMRSLLENRSGKYYVAGKEYATLEECERVADTIRQSLKDEIQLYMDDIAQTLFPSMSKDDQSWENGARNFILALFYALTDDVLYERIPEEKLCLHNVYYILSHNMSSEDGLELLRKYFEAHKSNLICYSKAQTILTATDRTLSSFVSTIMQYVDMLADSGIRCMTSGNEFSFTGFDKQPVAIFIIFPDELVSRQRYVSLFLIQAYKMLVNVAEKNAQAGLTDDMKLMRRCYFIMDEFGNLPKLHRFDDVATIARSRDIFFICVLQSYSQLDTVYGKDAAIKILAQLQIKIFIGTDDSKTIQSFSELCGKKKIITKSVSLSVDKDSNDSYAAKEQPLISTQKLQLLCNGLNGFAVVSCLGQYPIMTQFTPSYKAVGVLKIGNSADITTKEPELFISERFEHQIADISNAIAVEKPREKEKVVPAQEDGVVLDERDTYTDEELEIINAELRRNYFFERAQKKLMSLVQNRRHNLYKLKEFLPEHAYDAIMRAPHRDVPQVIERILTHDDILDLVRLELASMIELSHRIVAAEREFANIKEHSY
ncbi:MAG: type IV secretory system conjugative DNA transfer family protein [Christensenellaceae bacterium]|jgi:type IV secretion system protein VirD4|nr:type IV secretory system conjugative DNA transfer family protein [Christensenellaceae bacterium]